MSRPQATATQLVDEAGTRVPRFDCGAGAETSWHRHGFDYVITAVTDCEVLLEELGGVERTITALQSNAYVRDAGVEHNVINNSTGRMSFVEVELK